MGSVGVSAEHPFAVRALGGASAHRWRQFDWLLYSAFYLLIANIPYWIAAREFGFIPLGWFCVQYLIVGLLALAVPRLLSVLLFLLVFFADLLCGFCASYSLPIRESLQNIRAAHAISGARFLCALAVAILALLTAIASTRFPAKLASKKHRLRAAVSLLLFAALIGAADTLTVWLTTGYLPQTLRSDVAPDALRLHSSIPHLTRIPVIRLMRMEMSRPSIGLFARQGPASNFPVPSATAVGLHAAGILTPDGARQQPNLVLVLVESWGLSQDPRLRQKLVAPYLRPELAAKYDLRQGAVPFYGPTIDGEARELCGSGIGFYLLVAPARDLESCIPRQLDALGYQTIAIHGMTGKMFDREEWYKRVGFQQTAFHEQFQRAGLPDCTGALIGTCDAALANWIGNQLIQPSEHPYFIHWMTLNSHLPVSVPSPLANGASCSADLSLTPGSALCSWYQLVANVHESVSQLAIENLARPTIFVIVGDHAPPFSDPSLRSRFSPTDVPYVILVPRILGSQPQRTLAASAPSSAAHPDRSSRESP